MKYHLSSNVELILAMDIAMQETTVLEALMPTQSIQVLQKGVETVAGMEFFAVAELVEMEDAAEDLALDLKEFGTGVGSQDISSAFAVFE